MYVLEKLYGKTYPAEAVHLGGAVQDVYECIRNTIVQKRGHQVMLLGARSTGKSLVVHHGLERARREFGSDFLVVRVNGAVQSEDRLALREIAKQLDQQIGGALDEPIEKASMSLTLKTLNMLFQAQQAEDGGGGGSGSGEGSGEVRKSVVFVIDELEKYASNHQVLAYELLDWCQSALCGVAVIGMSVRMNVVDLLEKRNRSRNTAKVVALGKPASVDALCQIGRELLRDEHGALLIDDNNDNNDDNNNGVLQRAAAEVFYTSNSVRHLAALLLPHALSRSSHHNSDGSGGGDGSAVAAVAAPFTSEHLLEPLESIPELDLSLVVCAARALLRFDTVSVNLVIVLDEWRALAGAVHSARFQMAQKPAPKPGSTPASLRAVRYAWERLREMGLLEPVGGAQAQEDLRMFVPELDIEDVRALLPRNHVLYEWTTL